MGRQPCCQKNGLKRGPWTIEEDHKLMSFILSNGIQCWRLVPKLAGLLRCGKSCRLRWINYLRPDLKRGAFTEAEEDMIIQLHSRLGNRWSKIAAQFPGRTDNEIKNHWNTRIKKKLKNLGLDPATHKPIDQNEKCDTKGKQILQFSSSIEQETMELDTHNSLDLQDYQMSKSETTFNSGLEEEIILAHINEMNSSLGMKPTVMTNKMGPSNTFSMGMGENLSEDFLQHLIYSPLPWDFVNNLGDDIL